MVKAHVLIRFQRTGSEGNGAVAEEPSVGLPQFDPILTALMKRADCYGELDGSFAWRGPTADNWQVFGQLHDGRFGLDSLELRGCCPAEAMEAFLAMFTECELTFQRLPDGTMVERAEMIQLFAP